MPQATGSTGACLAPGSPTPAPSKARSQGPPGSRTAILQRTPNFLPQNGSSRAGEALSTLPGARCVERQRPRRMLPAPWGTAGSWHAAFHATERQQTWKRAAAKGCEGLITSGALRDAAGTAAARAGTDSVVENQR